MYRCVKLPTRLYRSVHSEGYYTRYTTDDGRRIRVPLGDTKEDAARALEALRERLKREYGLAEPRRHAPPPRPRAPRVSIRAVALAQLRRIRARHLAWLLLGVICLATLGFRVYGISWKPLWLDEVDELCRALPEFTFSEVVERAASHTQPPLDYLVAWQTGRISPYPPVIRIPYLLYGLGFCIVMWLWARRELGTPGMLVAAAWLAISSFHIHYTQEIRMYALMMLLGAAYFYVLGTALSRRTFAWWLATGALATLNLYTNIFTVFTLAVSGLYVCLWVLVNRNVPTPSGPVGLAHKAGTTSPARRPGWRTIAVAAIALLAAAALFAPFFAVHIYATLQPDPMFEQGALGVFNPWQSLEAVLIDFAARPRSRLAWSGVYVALLAVGCIPRRRRDIPLCVMNACMLTAYPVGLAFLMSRFSNIAFKGRYACQAFPFFVLALSAGVITIGAWLSWIGARLCADAQRPRVRAAVRTAVAVLLGAFVLWIELPATRAQLRLEKSPWHVVTAAIKKDYADYSLVTSQLDESLRWSLDWYMQPRNNWRYMGLEELPKFFLEQPVRLWVIVDERKLRAKLSTLSNTFDVTHIKAFYPSVYALRSRRVLEWGDVLTALQPLSDTMDPYAVATRQQYIMLGRARKAVRDNRPAAAINNYRGALSISFKKDIWINLEFARYLREQREYEEATRQYEIFFRDASPMYKASVLEEMVDVYDTLGRAARSEELLAQFGSDELRLRRRLQRFLRNGRAALDNGRPYRAYSNFFGASALDPTNVYVCRTLAAICADRLAPPDLPQAIAWNRRAAMLHKNATGTRSVETDFNTALLYSRAGLKFDAVQAFADLADYLNTRTPGDEDWLYKSLVYEGVTAEEMRDLEAALRALQQAATCADDDDERIAVSNHLARVRDYLYHEQSP